MNQRNDVTNSPAPENPCRSSNGEEAAEEGGTKQRRETLRRQSITTRRTPQRQSITTRGTGTQHGRCSAENSKMEVGRVKKDNKTRH